MAKSYRAAAALVLVAAFAGPALGEVAPPMPDNACGPALSRAGAREEALCGRSLRHWTDVYAREQEQYIVAEQAGKKMQSLHELTFLGHIRAGCADVRGLGPDADLPETVMAADRCLRPAYEYGQIGKTNVIGIVKVGEILQKVGRTLKARLEAAPQ
jgi:hypothetical protein